MKKIFLFICLLSYLNVFAQERENQLTGIMFYDSQVAFNSTRTSMLNDSLSIIYSKKSPFLAGIMSAAVPGLGQFYNKDYWKSAIFIAVEAAAIYAAVYYDNQGDDKTTLFENYAKQNWSVNRYAKWSYENATTISGKELSDEQKAYYANTLINKEGVVNWNVLNDLETFIGKWYSHRLAPYKDQQYYEMIGKYPQFVAGWDDFEATYPDKVFLYPDYKDKVTPHFLHYTSMRGTANDQYSKAKTFVTIIIVNHVLSAIEAAWTTSRYNKKLAVNVSMAKHNIGFTTEYYPQMNFKYSL